MSTSTTTIRVPRTTRDRLAALARERGLSLSALLTDIAEQHRREAIWRSAREANRIDAANPAVVTEVHEWETTLEDGLD